VPPASYASSITPAPTPASIVDDLMKSTTDYGPLALSDKEYVWQNGKKEDADKVFDSIKGKSVEIPGAVVVAATADQVQVAVSDDSQATNPPVADFTFAMKEPLTKIPAVGDKITIDGTYASYTQSPLMVSMSDGSIVTPKAKPTAKAPVHHTTHK
jgi:hypothetical protein